MENTQDGLMESLAQSYYTPLVEQILRAQPMSPLRPCEFEILSNRPAKNDEDETD